MRIPESQPIQRSAELHLSDLKQHVSATRDTTSAECSQWLAIRTMRTSQARARESSAERAQRLSDLKQHISATRDRDTRAERSQWLANQTMRTSRARESNVEHEQRLATESRLAVTVSMQ